MTLKPWLATYRDNGIPETVNADAWPSVVHLLEDAMRRYADKPAFADRKFNRMRPSMARVLGLETRSAKAG